MKRSEENWKDTVAKIVLLCFKYLDLLFYDITNKLIILGCIDALIIIFNNCSYEKVEYIRNEKFEFNYYCV